MRSKNKILFRMIVLVLLTVLNVNNTSLCFGVPVKKGAVQKNREVTVFGITIGKTTKRELWEKYTIMNEEAWCCDRSYSLLVLKAKEFCSGILDVKEVVAIVSPKKTVDGIGLLINGKIFSLINPTLSEKYVLFYKEGTRKDDIAAVYKSGDVNIVLDQNTDPSNSFLFYETKTVTKLKQLYKKRSLRDSL